jgi:hypothetical protein
MLPDPPEPERGVVDWSRWIHLHPPHVVAQSSD